MIIIKEKNKCTGCHVCSSICPQNCIIMVSDSEGFWYPEVRIESCTDCGKCESVCPILNKQKVANDPQAFACINKDESIRMKSSSGGIFTIIAEQMIDNNGFVFGAGFDEKFSVSHCSIETKSELEKLRSSKYVQSKIGDTYKQAKDLLQLGRQVLFTGTPCQIGGLRSYLGQTYDNLFCIDIICHGVPSPKVWNKYITYQENHVGAHTQRIAFRRKDEGWKRFSVSFLFDNNTEYRQIYEKDLYMQAFMSNVCLRPSCYACNFKTVHRESDITLGDFWGIQNLLPELDDDKGTSLVFVNSTRGEAMFDRLRDKILYQAVDINQAVLYNSAAIKSVEQNPNRKKFLYEVDYLPFDKLVKKYCHKSIFARLKRKIKSKVLRVL